MHETALVTADDPSSLAPVLIPARGGDDPVARCLLRRAQGALQKWPEGFRGFRASVRCEESDGVVVGRVTVMALGQVEVACDDPALRAQLHDMLRTIALERTPRFFDHGDGRFPVSFGDGGAHAAGRLIKVQARLGRLEYCLDAAGRIRQVERVARGLRVLTCFEEYTRTTPGRVLPARTTTSTWDLANGALLDSQSIHDTHRRVEHVWLPASRRISGSRGPSVLVSLDEHALL